MEILKNYIFYVALLLLAAVIFFMFCSEILSRASVSGFFFWVFVALKWVWIPCCMSQIIVSEMGSSLLNLMLFFLLCSLEKNVTRKSFSRGSTSTALCISMFYHMPSSSCIAVNGCLWDFARTNWLHDGERAMKVSCCSKLFVLVSRYMTIKSDRQRGL